ncbi:MAG: LD-carboxypeptidase [Streptosporangiales bacterium]|nr:LD-carboxypeptidase [Streptosporangiales bacterium]MBO0891621.1 LD-carboxypeptidase [Acidothermales bacterium]
MASSGTPPTLRAGDRVALVAPSGPVGRDRLDRAVVLLRSLGLDVVVGAHAYDRSGYLAGTDAHRAADLQDAWCDPAVRGVVCARGGYGATRLLSRLDWTALATADPKLLHGASDVTALHAAFAARLGTRSWFGPMPASDVLTDGDPEPVSWAGVRAAWFDGAVGPLPGTRRLAPGVADGPLVGGNLSLLAAALGTPYAGPTAAGAVALLEDVAEAPYRVDRMLTQLLDAGWFDGVAGVALGSWPGCGHPEAVLADRLGSLGVPVLAGLDVGHDRPQRTVPLGARAHLDADALCLSFP